MDAVGLKKAELIKKIPTLDTIYVLYSKLTRVPYLVCDSEDYEDEVFLFLQEEDALEKAKSFEKEQPLFIGKVENAGLLQLFTSFLAYGVTSVLIGEEGETYKIPLQQIVKRQDTSALPPEKRPLENPQLQTSMIYYMQILRKDPKAAADHRDMDEEMSMNLIRGQYLVPFKEDEQDGKKVTQLVMIKMNNGSTMLPIFSDTMEFQKFRGKQDLHATISDISKLSEMPMPEGATGYVLNPTGVGLPLTMPYMKALSDRKNKIENQE